MQLSNRTKELIRILLDQKGPVTIDRIAGKMNISPRTVYRELPEAASVMEKYKVTLVTVSKQGVAVVGNAEDIRKLRGFLGDLEELLIVNPEERADYILMYLLHQEDFVKMEAIAIDHQYALSTVRNDLQKIRQRVSVYDLKLIQQKGQGIRLHGVQMEKNHLLTDILLHQADETDIYRWLDREERESNPFLGRLEEYGFRETLQQMHSCLKETLQQESRTMKGLKSREYLEIVFLLAFLVCHHGQKQAYTQYMTAALEERRVQSLYRRIRKRLEDFFSLELRESEQTYLQWVIQVSLGPDADRIITVRNQTLNEHILKFISYVEEHMGIHLSGDRELRDGLYAHMDKALLRIRSHMQIENAALSEIRKDYGEIFRLVREGVSICFPEDYFPDDEIGYLVLYFALALEKLTKQSFRVLVVCSGGMGSSKMLSSAVEREIPEVKVVKTLSVVALEKEDLSAYDLILSTIPLYMAEDAYLRVSPMLYREEVAQIREKIRRHKYRVLRHIDDAEKRRETYQNGDHETILHQAEEISRMAWRLIEGIRFVTVKGRLDDKNGGLRALKEQGIFPGMEEMLQMKKESCFQIPMMPVLYYEGTVSGLEAPVLKVLLCEREPGAPQEPDTAVVVCYLEELSKHEKRALYSLIEMMFQKDGILNAVCERDLEEMKYGMGICMRDYLGRFLME